MKTLAPLALSLSLALTACSSASDKVDWIDHSAEPMQDPQFMQDMMAAGAPGSQHEALASRAGSWTVE